MVRRGRRLLSMGPSVCVDGVGEAGGVAAEAADGEEALAAAAAAAAASSSAFRRCSSRARSRWRTVSARSCTIFSSISRCRYAATHQMRFHGVTELVELDYLST